MIHFDFLISAMTVGITLFCISLLWCQLREQSYRWPLMIFLLVQGAVAFEPIVFLILERFEILYIAISAPIWMLMAPSLWMYIRGLTAREKWVYDRQHWCHLLPFIYGTVVGVIVLSLSETSQQTLFFSETDVQLTKFESVVSMLIFSLFVFWPIQSAFYVYKILRDLSAYQVCVRQIFTNEKNKTLSWVIVALLLLCSSWLWLLINLIDSFFAKSYIEDTELTSVFNLLTVWFFSFWAFNQKSAFSELYHEISVDPVELTKPKYEKSALSQTQAQRIESKLNHALTEEALFLNPDLTLYILSKHLHIPASYVTQTLNQTMGTTFFEWVNKARIKQAQHKLLTSEDSVLNIAMAVGYNSRSAFYKSFKSLTGCTPTQYRQSHKTT